MAANQLCELIGNPLNKTWSEALGIPPKSLLLCSTVWAQSLLRAMNAWASEILPCKKCIHCDFRAERDKERKMSTRILSIGEETCCETCTGHGNHASHCPSLTREARVLHRFAPFEALERCYWECVPCDVAAREDAKCLVVPSNRDGPSPAAGAVKT